MTGKSHSSQTAPWARGRRVRAVASVALSALLAVGNVQAGDLLRKGATMAETMTAAAATAGSGPAVSTAPAMLGNSDRLARTTQALTAVQQMQNAARNLAIAGSNSLRAGLPAVPVNSYLQTNGLMPASGSNKLWVGANTPVQTTLTTGSTTTTNVTIAQTQQQALLTWDTFNIGKNTTLTFDQGAGGINVGQWIAFNYVRDNTGNPTQILGSLKTIGTPDAAGNATAGGQVYVMNSNGIIFGGSSQVNTHGLVASSLPINYNLIQRGILNNPDAQFLFSALPLTGGSKGPTSNFDPTVAVAQVAPIQTPLTSDGSYGDVVVQPGASLTAPTSADHVGGRIALVGPNVTNAGRISTADGQTILAAGLQVGFVAHNSADPTLRGLDVIVGKVADSSLPNQPPAGTATNAGLDATNLGVGTTAFNTAATNPGALKVLGLIEAPRGDVYITGKTVNQSGVINSSTSVSYNGRVDLLAGYNAVSNSRYDPSPAGAADFTNSLPFLYQSNVGNNVLTGDLVANSGLVTFGADSVVRILPETDSTDRIVGDLALPSQINVQGQAVHFLANSEVLAPGATVLTNRALGSDGSALDAGVAIHAGRWFSPGDTSYRFVQTDDDQQIYFDTGAKIDVAGLADVSAPVSENIVDVELRGTELADSPLQRDGPLRGLTIQVDVRQHGPWDATLNGGLGGYTWVGTPLANTAGWIGLTTHSVAELTTNGGTVSLKAGGAVVMQSGATIDVSGGSIAYQGGVTHTTKVISGGHVLDISQASPNLSYDGVYTGVNTTYDSKWGISTSTFNALALGTYSNGYTQGGNGGGLTIASSVMALDGTMRGNTVTGPLQRTLSPAYNPASPPSATSPVAVGEPGWLLGALSLPLPSQLSVTVKRQYLLNNGVTANYVDYSPTPANLVIKSGPAPVPAEAFRTDGDYQFSLLRNYEIDLAPSLVNNDSGAGFGILRLDNSYDNPDEANPDFGNITVARGSFLELPVGGSLSFSAGKITIADNTKATERTGIHAPGGWIGLTAYDVSPNLAQFTAQQVGAIEFPVYDPDRGRIVLGTGVTLDTAGELVDDRSGSLTATRTPLVTAGGKVSLAGNTLLLKPGSVVNVSGGGAWGTSGKLTYANAGAISLVSGKAQGSGFGAVLGGDLQLSGAVLQGYAGVGKTGGSLSLRAPSISVVASLNNGAKILTDAGTGTLSLAPDFFDAGGFSSYSLTALGVAVDAAGNVTGAHAAVVIGSPDTPAAGGAPAIPGAATIVRPTVQNWQSVPGGTVYTADTGVRGSTKLTFKATIEQFDFAGDSLNNDSSLVLRNNATIQTDPGGGISLGGSTVDVLGSLISRGGSIAVSDNGDKALGNLPTIHLGPASVLDASGTAVYGQDFSGYHKVDVLSGGAINLDGNIVAEGAGTVKDERGNVLLDGSGVARRGAGALLDVSGSSNTVQLSPGDPTASTLRPGGALVSVVRSSNGGTLTIKAEKELFSAATLKGGPGVPSTGEATTASGGDLVISSALVKTDGSQPGPSDPTLILASSTPNFVYTGLGQQVTDGATKFGDSQGFGLIWFGADSFNRGNFGSLSLKTAPSALQVTGGVTLTASRQLSVADGGVLLFVPVANGAPPAPATLNLNAPYVVLGQPFQPPLEAASLDASPTAGTGTLTVRAGTLLDVGNLVLQGASTAVLTVTGAAGTGGSIRGNGTLDVAGNITLQAGQIYPPTSTTFNVVAQDFTVNSVLNPGSVTIQNSAATTAPSLPLSAGGTLNLYASQIVQGGVLRAPVGTIQLGTPEGTVDPLTGQSLSTTSSLVLQPGSVTSVSSIDPVTGKAVTVPFGINVNGDTWIDPTGADITSVGPAAKSISLTANSINLAGGSSGQAGAQIDLTGGGDLYAYQFVPGTGGTSDILRGTTANAFAIIPGFMDHYSPFAPYNAGTEAAAALGSDSGYVVANAALGYHVGDRIHLEGGGGLPAGDYTLLPARYSTLTGACLITPVKGNATAGAAHSAVQLDGSTVMSGYRFNGFDGTGSVQDQFNSFSVAPQSVVLSRAQYDSFSANTFFTGVATTNNTAVPRLPLDAGQLVLAAGSALSLHGTVAMAPATKGRGGFVDISSSADILIGSTSVLAGIGPGAGSGQLLLDASELSGFGAESLLIGGVRSTVTGGTAVTVTTGNVTVDNAGEALTGPDVVLVANKNLTLAPGAEVHSSGKVSAPVDTLQVTGTIALNPTAGNNTLTLARGGVAVLFPEGTPAGDTLKSNVGVVVTAADGTSTSFSANTAFTLAAGSTVTLNAGGTLTATFNSTGDPVLITLGDGALLRVSSDPTAQIARTGVASSTAPVVTVGAGAKIAGASVVLDSTNSSLLDSTAVLTGKSLTLDSGQISLQLTPNLGSPQGLVLTQGTLTTLLSGADSLSLLSYTSFDLYGTGQVGATDAAGNPLLGSLGLHAGEIRGFNTGASGEVLFAAKNLALDNSAGGAGAGPGSAPAGTIAFKANKITLGSNQLAIDNFARVTLTATDGIVAKGSGGLAAAGGLMLDTPLLTGATGASQTLSTPGGLVLKNPAAGAGTDAIVPGLGASFTLVGASIAAGGNITLPGGSLTLHANGAAGGPAGSDVNITGTLKAEGTVRHFNDVTKYTNGGNITLQSDAGNVTIASGSTVSVAANEAGGSAGQLTVSAPKGNLTVAAGTLLGTAGANGQGGAFALDAAAIQGADPTASHLTLLNTTLTTGGFDRAQTLRIRTGNVVADGTARAHGFDLSADAGSITVTGTVDASGLLDGGIDPADPTGGSINLSAAGSIVLAPSSWLNAAGYAYDNAGKGGSIFLSAGSYTYRGGIGQANTAAIVDVQSGSRIDLGVANPFTVEDLVLNAGTTPPASTRTDLVTGTLHLRESQIAFGSGTQFSTIGSSVSGASGIVLEGFQVFDLSGTSGTVSTTGAITSIGTGGLINSTVQTAVKANGTAFVGGVNAALLNNPLFHVQPGAEIVDRAVTDGTVTSKLVTLYNSNASGRSALNFNLTPGAGVFTSIAIPGGLAVDDRLTTTNGRQFTVTTADGVTSGLITANSNTVISSASSANPVVAVNFRNSGSTALSVALNFNAGNTPVGLALGTTTPFTTTNAANSTATSGDLALVNNWNLATYRFGPQQEPGNLTLRATGNLIFGQAASLSDGFDTTNAADPNNPLWTAQLLPSGSRSWSYRLVAGADTSAVAAQTVQPLSQLAANSGSVLLGKGSASLPTGTGNSATRLLIIPQFFQTIRTGTGDIDIAAGRDVQWLNPLATIYTAGQTAASLANFDVPVLNVANGTIPAAKPYYPALYSLKGGNVTITAQNDLARYQQDSSGNLKVASSSELPSNWLYRRSSVGPNGLFTSLSGAPSTEIQSTSWWIDFSNFFADVGALGGGNVTLSAGRNVTNVDAAVPTNARMPGKDASSQPIAPDAAKLRELGGGNLAVQAGGNIDGGVYYVERGTATVHAVGDIMTNATRVAFLGGDNSNPVTWLPTTFLLGKGQIDISAGGDVRVGQVANPFWLPPGLGNRTYETSYFSTFDPTDSVSITSLSGTIFLQGQASGTNSASNGANAWLLDWYANYLSGDLATAATYQPWLRLAINNPSSIPSFQTVAAVMPATLSATAYSGDIDLIGSLVLAPAQSGTLDLLAAKNINGLTVNGVNGSALEWRTASINLSDADPARLPSGTNPVSFATYADVTRSIPLTLLTSVDSLFGASGRTNLSLAEKLALHAQLLLPDGSLAALHYNDPAPLRLYSVGGDISGLTLYSGKTIQAVAGRDITDVALYVQNAHPGDTTVVAAGRDVILYDPTSALRIAAQQPGNLLTGLAGDTGPAGGTPTAGDIQMAGPGSLEVLAGRNLTLGSGSNATSDGTAAGINSIGSELNPALRKYAGADILATAGVQKVYTPAAAALGMAPGLATTSLDFAEFISKFLDPSQGGANAARYLPYLGVLMKVAATDSASIWAAFHYSGDNPLTEQQAIWVLGVFNRVMRDAARDRNNPDSPAFGTYTNGFAAITALYPGSPQPTKADLASTVPVVRPAGPWAGRLSLSTREIKTFEGGAISLLVPGGDITVGRPTDPQKPDQGILTERGGGISIFAADSVNVGTSRIFTLRGGDEVIWSTWGNIAAGSGSKTVFSAPPTRVLIDPQSGDVQNDLAGLATGSGIGVLATLAGVKPGDVDLIAPVGTIDAGDAGIRSSGNLNLAARVVLNASNIQVGGSSTGTPPPPPSPNLGSLTAASSASAGASSAASDVAKQNSASNQVAELPSLITVEVLGYGGGEGDEPEAGGDEAAAKDKDRRKKPEGTP